MPNGTPDGIPGNLAPDALTEKQTLLYRSLIPLSWPQGLMSRRYRLNRAMHTVQTIAADDFSC
jgi:hypothetical protein